MRLFGVDYGTTSSSVCVYEQGTCEPVPLSEEGPLRSVLSYFADGDVAVGEVRPGACRVVRCPKRSFGEEASREDNLALLREVKRRAVGHGERMFAVVSVPVHYNHHQRLLMKSLCALAGIEVLRLVQEPSAIALSVSTGGESVLVVDVGGGTTDIALVELTEGVYDVTFSRGFDGLGGEAVNELIAEALPSVDDVEGHKLSGAVPQEVLWPFLDRVAAAVQECLAECLIPPDRAVVAGGGSRLVGLLAHLQRCLFPTPVELVPDSVYACSRGAAIYASVVCFPSEAIVLSEVLPTDLGVEVHKSLMHCVVPRGSPVPCSRSAFFSRDTEEVTCIRVLQGNDPVSKKNFLVGEVTVRLGAEERVEVCISVDMNSLISVHVKSYGSGKLLASKDFRAGENQGPAQPTTSVSDLEEVRTLLRAQDLVRKVKETCTRTPRFEGVGQRLSEELSQTPPEKLKSFVKEVESKYKAFLIT